MASGDVGATREGAAGEVAASGMKGSPHAILGTENAPSSLPLHPASSEKTRLEEVENALKENAAHTTALSSKLSEDLDKIRTAWENQGFYFTAE